MIWILLFILVKVFGKERVAARLFRFKAVLPPRTYFMATAFMIAGFLIALPAYAQEMRFKVVQNDHAIGWIHLKKTERGANSLIELDSEIKKRVVFVISVIEKQQVEFNHGIMVKSYVFRKVNDDVKLNKQTSFAGNCYEVKNPGKPERLGIQRISYNQLSLYFEEPVTVREVYSDNYQQFLPIVRMADSCYKVQMPDGNCNYYYYKNGQCVRIKVQHSLFSIEFLRV